MLHKKLPNNNLLEKMSNLYLQDYIAAIDHECVSKTSNANPQITSVTNDSRHMETGALFVAIKGSHSDGHAYLDTAVKNGAVALIVSSDYKGPLPNVPCIYVRDSYFAWASVCECHANYPAKSLCLHTVTGTNGKTSTVFFLRHLMQESSDRKVGMLSTICTDTGNRIFPSRNTMPDAASIQNIFMEMKQNKVTDVIMESSSHGLHQHRVGHAKFHTAAFTNLTGDHLDYHGDMEHYYAAKKILFLEMLDSEGSAIINIDDFYGKRLFSECKTKGLKNIIGFSFTDNPSAFCRVTDINFNIGNTQFACIINQEKYEFRTPLTGEFNLKNTVTAILMAIVNNISLQVLQNCVNNLPQVPGRLQRIPLQNGANAYVDYAHTDDALHMVLNDLRRISQPGTRIITIFGCGGDRDHAKRPRMGAVAQKLSDFVIVTDDNPRTEASNVIIRDILSGMSSKSEFLRIIPSRADAIKFGISLSRKGDILLVAGKGHEDYQEINNKRSHFSDCEILQKFALLQ